MPNGLDLKEFGLSGLAGFTLAGDLGDFTWYTTRRGKRVAFLRAPPTTAPTIKQVKQRRRFILAQQRWAQLTADQKAALEQATNTLSIVMTGQNLWMTLQLTQNPTVWLHLQPLLPPGFPTPDWIPP